MKSCVGSNFYIELWTSMYIELLGYLPVKGALYGEGAGPILLDNVICRGSEANLLECSHQPLFDTNCNHTEDAGVKCQGIIMSSVLYN